MTREIVIGSFDLAPDARVLKREQVPPVSEAAIRRVDDYGAHDVIFDDGERRWRFRHGKLIKFLGYGGKPRRPVEIWDGSE